MCILIFLKVAPTVEKERLLSFFLILKMHLGTVIKNPPPFALCLLVLLYPNSIPATLLSCDVPW